MSARLVLDPGCTIMNPGISRVGRGHRGRNRETENFGLKKKCTDTR